jgi:hypothetical protein
MDIMYPPYDPGEISLYVPTKLTWSSTGTTYEIDDVDDAQESASSASASSSGAGASTGAQVIDWTRVDYIDLT